MRTCGSSPGQFADEAGDDVEYPVVNSRAVRWKCDNHGEVIEFQRSSRCKSCTTLSEKDLCRWPTIQAAGISGGLLEADDGKKKGLQQIAASPFE